MTSAVQRQKPHEITEEVKNYDDDDDDDDDDDQGRCQDFTLGPQKLSAEGARIAWELGKEGVSSSP